VSGVGNPSFPVLYVPVVAYRGARTYVHSTTLYTELMAAADAAMATKLPTAICEKFARQIFPSTGWRSSRYEESRLPVCQQPAHRSLQGID